MLSCHICKSKCYSIAAFLKHYRFHRSLPNVQYLCPFPRCKKNSVTFSSLRTHLSRYHNDRECFPDKYEGTFTGCSKSVSDAMPITHCHTNSNSNSNSSAAVCKCSVAFCNRSFPKLEELIRHLKIHLHRDLVAVTCPIDDCQKVYKLKSSFSSHLSRKHSSRILDENLNLELDSDSQSLCNSPQYDVEEGNIIEEADLSSSLFEKFPVSLDRSCALFYLSLQAKKLIPQNTIQFILQELSNLYNIGWEDFIDTLVRKLSDLKLSRHVIDEVVKLLQESDNFRNLISENGPFSTKYKRISYYKTNFRYIEPQKIEIGIDASGTKRFLYYIPIKQTLNSLFSDSSFVKQYNNPILHNKDVLSDIQDGFVYQKNSFLTDEKNLKIILYQDGFEIVNPIGTAKTKHKVLGVYFTLSNLYPWNRSKIDAIQLLMLCYEKDVSNFGCKVVFKPLLDDISTLESEGFENINGISGVIKGTVVSCLGDNLGSHIIGGFTESFQGEYFCRYCLYSKSDAVNEIKDQRDEVNYKNALAHLNLNPNLNSYQGIKCDSVLNRLSNYHVTKGMPPCIGHDIFEGVVSYDLQLIVDYFCKKKWLSYDMINKELKLFDFKGNEAVDRPCPLKAKRKKLSGNAMQLWCFIRFFPLIFHSKILDLADPVWKLLLLLHEIVLYVCAPRISRGQVCYMEELVTEYISSRQRLFPETPLKPKHHYFLHYSLLTMQFGPLIRLWTMRMESKHSYFKRCVRRFQNCKNICCTLAEQHQYLQAYYLSGSLFGPELSIENAEPFMIENFNESLQEFLSSNGEFLSDCLVTEKIVYRGIIYKKSNILLLLDNSLSNLAGKIKVFFTKNTTVFCLIEVYEAITMLDCGVNLLQTNLASDKFRILPFNTEKVFDFYPLQMYNVFDKDCFVLKHKIPNKM